MHSSTKPESIKQRLDAMPMEDFEVLLKRVAGNRNQEPMPEHAEILSVQKQLESHVKVQPDESIPMLTNAKYSSSLQSLNQRSESGKGDQNANPVVLPHSVLVNSNSQDKGKGHHYHHYHHSNHHTSTLTTINSTSSLNSIGVDSAGVGAAVDEDKFNRNKYNNNTSNGDLSSPDSKYSCDYKSDYKSTSSPPPLELPPLPHAYFFNERDPDVQTQNGYRSGTLESPPGGSYNQRRTTASLDSSPSQYSCRSANNSLQLSEEYPSVASLTTGGSSAPSLVSSVNSVKNTQNSSEMTRCLTPNFPSQGMVIAKSPSEGSNTDRISRRGLTDRPLKKKTNKNLQRETQVDIENLPGFRGTDDIENLVQFVEGTDTTAAGKKTKKREPRGKEKDTLVKSASLDENHLNYNAKRSNDPVPSNSKSLKELEKKSEKAVSANPIPSLTTDKATTVYSQNQTTSRKEKETSKDEVFTPITGKEEDKVVKDESSEGPFELVQSKKRKTKRSSTQREAESFSRGKATEQSRREQTRSRRSVGDRRKSVGSVPGSDNSDQSDDDSVRSLPAGECTPKERVPKQCASSGGTPQTSYADIARMTDGNKTPQVNNCNSTGSPFLSRDTARENNEISQKTANANSSPAPPTSAATPVAPPKTLKTVKTKSGSATESGESVRGEVNAREKPQDCPQQRPEGDSLCMNKKINPPPPPLKISQPYMQITSKKSYLACAKSDEINKSGVVNNCGDGIKVLIEDKTEFPEINASISNSRTPQIPFGDRNHKKNGTIATMEPKRMDKTPVRGKDSAKVNDSWKVISNEHNISSQFTKEEMVIAIEPVVVQTLLINKDDDSQTPPQPAEEMLVNGDHQEVEDEVPAFPRRNRESVSLSASSGDVPVVFCGGNFEREIPASQDIGFEFGFNVMSAMSCQEVSPAKSDNSQVSSQMSSPQDIVHKDLVPQSPAEASCPVQTVPDTEKPDSLVDSNKYRPYGGSSLLGSYRGPNPPYVDSRRGSHPQFTTPRHPRMPGQNYRNHQRNGGVYMNQHGPPQSPYAMHLPHASGPIPPPLIQQQQYGPPHIVPPGQATFATMLPGSPYGGPPQTGGSPRGSAPLVVQPNPTFIMPAMGGMYNPNSEEGAISPSSGNSGNVGSPNPSGGFPSPNNQIITQHPFISTVYYDGGLVQVPYGSVTPHLYYNPTNYSVPVAAIDVETWMNSYVHKAYNLGAQGQLDVHRIDDLNN